MSKSKHLPIYRVGYQLLSIVTELVRHFNRDFRPSLGHRVPRSTLVPNAMAKVRDAPTPEKRRASANSYLGLMRQSSAHAARARLCKRMMMHGHSVDYKLTRAHAQSNVRT